MVAPIQKSTQDYDIFESHEQNRLLGNASPRRDLLLSLRQHGFKPAFPILCTKLPNGKLKIHDGHNRFITAVHLGLPIEYKIHDAEDLLSPTEISGTQKSWSIGEYSNAWAHDPNKPDFAEVEAFHRDTGISVNAAYSLFAGEVCGSNNYGVRVKNGSYKIKNRDIPYRVARLVGALALHCNFATHIYLVGALSKVIHIEGIDLNRLVERIHRHPELLGKQRTCEQYIDMLELIYNRNTKLEKLYFRAGVDKAMQARRICKTK